MGEGRGSALMFLCITFLLMAACSRTVDGAVYVVGGAGGWTFDVAGWPAGKRFIAGDILVFNYNSVFHNVVSVSAAGYRSCVPSSGSRVWRSGRDRITLVRGTNYYICSIPGHCSANMKIAVSAS